MDLPEYREYRGDNGSRRHSPELLRSVLGAPLFAGIEPAEVKEILDAFDEQSFNRGHRITLEGLRGHDFYVIADGEARVTVDGWKVANLGPGDFFGEIAVLSEGPRTATVAAETPLRCLVLSNRALDTVLVAHPQMGVNLLRVVVNRFQELSGRGAPPSLRLATPGA
jgi:CRP/FNR family cyclic AMP-dependent transcriptional regulator